MALPRAIEKGLRALPGPGAAVRRRDPRLGAVRPRHDGRTPLQAPPALS